VWNPFILLDATRLVIQNAGAAGLDGQTVQRLKGKEWETARKLSEELRSGAYQPSAVRRVYIPKRDGKKRPLGIPNVRDRIVQRAIVLVMEPIYEQVFLPCSYGFRPKRKSVECVAEVANAVYRHRQVWEADIESFFDRVSHKKMLGMLKDQIVDARILRLIRGTLQAGFKEWGKPWEATKEGTPQGGPLSPMLANLYLHYGLDVKLWPVEQRTKGRIRLIRFADDFLVIGQSREELRFTAKCVVGWLKEVKLTLARSKTRHVDMRNYAHNYRAIFDFLGYTFHHRSFKDNPERFWIARQPSRKARKALHENLRAKLDPNLAVTTAREVTAQLWRGWSNYFRYGNSNRVLRKEERSVRKLFVRYLRRKYRRQKHPVPWRVLGPMVDPLKALVRAPRCIPDLLRQRELLWKLA
jgi:group II intron reverse transcriptase/maturase